MIKTVSELTGVKSEVKTMLVTGGAGFIGSNFIHYMLKQEKDIFIVNLDKLTYAGNLENLKDIENRKNYKFLKGDICDSRLLDIIFKEYDFDFVVHFAAESHVDRSILEPNIFIETNVVGTASLLCSAKKKWEESEWHEKRFLQISTDEVYGSLREDKKSDKFTEKTSLKPRSPYSASKASADHLVKSYFYTYGLPTLITRCSNNYGPYQFPEKLIPLIINNALNNKMLPVYGDGKNIRDWLYVEDHCDAIYTVLRKGKPGEVYNIGGNNELENIYIVNKICEMLDELYPIKNNLKFKIQNLKSVSYKDLITYVKDRLGHDRRYAIDATKMKKDLGWAPHSVFEEKLKDTIGWYLKNRDWVKHVTTGEYEKYYERMYD